MSTTTDIKNGSGWLLPCNKVDGFYVEIGVRGNGAPHEVDFDYKGCECCNSEEGRALGAEVGAYFHGFGSELADAMIFQLCNDCAYKFHY